METNENKWDTLERLVFATVTSLEKAQVNSNLGMIQDMVYLILALRNKGEDDLWYKAHFIRIYSKAVTAIVRHLFPQYFDEKLYLSNGGVSPFLERSSWLLQKTIEPIIAKLREIDPNLLTPEKLEIFAKVLWANKHFIEATPESRKDEALRLIMRIWNLSSEDIEKTLRCWEALRLYYNKIGGITHG